MAVSFQSDILPLFTQMDIEHMQGFGVKLASYDYMKQPDHAGAVYDQVWSGSMPPPDSGEERWPEHKVGLFKAWMDGGYQP